MVTKNPKGFNPLPYPNPRFDYGPNTPKSERNRFRKLAEKRQKAVVKSRDVAKAKAAAPSKVKTKTQAKNAAKAQQLSKAKNYVITQKIKNVGTSTPKTPSTASPPRTAPGSGSGGRSLYSRLTGGGLMKHGR